ncbi:MAG: hypothetical protein K2I87_01405, partial [Bacteroidales bacterium]|nr:hypothetical protein [Bacteroidales bacterium]
KASLFMNHPLFSNCKDAENFSLHQNHLDKNVIQQHFYQDKNVSNQHFYQDMGITFHTTHRVKPSYSIKTCKFNHRPFEAFSVPYPE